MLTSLDQNSFEWTEAKKKTVLTSDELRKRGEGPCALLSAHSSRTCLSDGMGMHMFLWHGQFTHL